ncbi:MAG: hypothetical protein HPY89_03265 [Pelotomaculum sp.]|nr:hypothetical protein [Pelotomaculum sp.]
MLAQLQANQGKKVVLELVNGRVVTGTVLAADEQFVRLGTDEGTATIPLNAVQIVWEPAARSLTEDEMKDIAEKLRESAKAQYVCLSAAGFSCPVSYTCRPPHSCFAGFICPGSFVDLGGGGVPCITEFYGFMPGSGAAVPGQGGYEEAKAQIACTAFPGFTCAQSYICRPPDTCTFSFACPGSYVPGFPQGGGCPAFFCGPFQFGQPCGPFQFQCRPFQFGQPCGPFQFGLPCVPFPFLPTCGPFQFQCRPFQFGGSVCPAPGGFICPGQQFIGVAGPPGTASAPGAPLSQPLPPTELSVKKEEQDKNK